MTQEEKAKAYDEALERANKELQVCGSTDCDAAKQIFRFFPELKESEDERIRKALIKYCKLQQKANNIGLCGISLIEIIAWLEKQGNNLVENGYTDNKDIIKYADNYSHEIWRKLMDNFENIKDYHIGCNDVSDIVLNAIIDAYNWLEKQGQKPAWSEDDEWKFTDILALLRGGENFHYNTPDLATWLKSLKQRMKGE